MHLVYRLFIALTLVASAHGLCQDSKVEQLIEARLKANAFVKYDGVWIKKEFAEKRRERAKK